MANADAQSSRVEIKVDEISKINRRSSRLIIIIISVIVVQIGLSIGLTLWALKSVDTTRKTEQVETWERFLRNQTNTLSAMISGYADWTEFAYVLKKGPQHLSKQDKEDWLLGNADKIDFTSIIIKGKVVIAGGKKFDKLKYLLNDERMKKIYQDYSMKKREGEPLIILNEKDYTILMLATSICDNSSMPVTEGIEFFAVTLNLEAVGSFLNAKVELVDPKEQKNLPKPFLKIPLNDTLDSQNSRLLYIEPNIDLFTLVLVPLGISLLLQLLITAAIIISFNFLMKSIGRLYNYLTAANKEMQKDLEMARRIQQGILPNIASLNLSRFLNIDSRYIALATLGGDLYDLIRIGRNQLGILMADVSGHGVPAALITAMVKVAFHNHSRWQQKPSETCFKVNNEIFDLINDHGYYLTAYYGILDFETGEFQYSNAGHHPALLIKHSSDKIISLSTEEGLFLGIQKDTHYSIGQVTLEPGDRLLLFTDGIIEARNEEDEFYEYERLYQFIQDNRTIDVNLFPQKLLDDVERFANQAVPNDDQAVLLLEYLGSSGAIQASPDSKELSSSDGPSSYLKEAHELTSDISRLIKQAREARQLGEFKQSVNLLETALEMNSTSSEVVRELLRTYLDMKDYDRAAELCENHLHLHPDDNEVYYIASYCYRKVGKLEKAADFGEQLYARDPNLAKNIVHLSDVYRKLGNKEKTLTLLNEANKLDPSNPGVIKRLEFEKSQNNK